MAFQQSVSVTVTTIADGSATAYTDPVRGKVVAVKYAKATSGNYSDGVDFTITTETTLRNVWVDTNINASETVYPRALVQDTAGADIAGSYDALRLMNERVKIVIGSGGDTKSGTFTVFYE